MPSDVSPNVPPESDEDVSPVFFVDRSLGSNIVPERLREENLNVEIHADHFPPDEQDDSQWLREAGEKDWIILTKDQFIQRNPLELSAIARSGAKVFVQASNANLTGEEMGEIFASAHKRIIKVAKGHKAPFIAKVYRDASVEIYRSSDDLSEYVD
jgi:hypothetical protein